MTLRCPDLARILRERNIDRATLCRTAQLTAKTYDRVVAGGPAEFAAFARIQDAINQTPGPRVRLQLILGEEPRRNAARGG